MQESDRFRVYNLRILPSLHDFRNTVFCNRKIVYMLCEYDYIEDNADFYVYKSLEELIDVFVAKFECKESGYNHRNNFSQVFRNHSYIHNSEVIYLIVLHYDLMKLFHPSLYIITQNDIITNKLMGIQKLINHKNKDFNDALLYSFFQRIDSQCKINLFTLPYIKSTVKVLTLSHDNLVYINQTPKHIFLNECRGSLIDKQTEKFLLHHITKDNVIVFTLISNLRYYFLVIKYKNMNILSLNYSCTILYSPEDDSLKNLLIKN